MREYKDVPEDQMRSQIGRFGITGPAQTLEIRHLSDGLKSRVVFAWLAYKSPHMLLLGAARLAMTPVSIFFLHCASRVWGGGGGSGLAGRACREGYRIVQQGCS